MDFGRTNNKRFRDCSIFGAISGALAASGVGLIGQVIGNAAIGAANDVADQLNGIRNGTNQEGFDIGSVLINGVIGGIAGFAGGPGAGNKGLTNIGLKNLNRTWDALTHKGVNAAIDVLGRGLTYFGKNARHMIKPLGKAIIKSSGSVIIGNTLKTVIS